MIRSTIRLAKQLSRSSIFSPAWNKSSTSEYSLRLFHNISQKTNRLKLNKWTFTTLAGIYGLWASDWLFPPGEYIQSDPTDCIDSEYDFWAYSHVFNSVKTTSNQHNSAASIPQPLVDDDPYRASISDCAKLVALSYEKNVEDLQRKVAAMPGWALLCDDRGVPLSKYDDNTGFYAVTFVNDDEKQAIIAFRGSDGIRDWFANISAFVVFDQEHPQEKFAKNYALDVSEQLRALKKNHYRMGLIGHSLGGALAPLGALELYKWGIEDCYVIAFDPPGLKSYYEQLSGSEEGIECVNEELFLKFSNLIFLSHPNPVNTLHEHLASDIYYVAPNMGSTGFWRFLAPHKFKHMAPLFTYDKKWPPTAKYVKQWDSPITRFACNILHKEDHSPNERIKTERTCHAPNIYSMIGQFEWTTPNPRIMDKSHFTDLEWEVLDSIHQYPISYYDDLPERICADFNNIKQSKIVGRNLIANPDFDARSIRTSVKRIVKKYPELCFRILLPEQYQSLKENTKILEGLQKLPTDYYKFRNQMYRIKQAEENYSADPLSLSLHKSMLERNINEYENLRESTKNLKLSSSCSVRLEECTRYLETSKKLLTSYEQALISSKFHEEHFSKLDKSKIMQTNQLIALIENRFSPIRKRDFFSNVTSKMIKSLNDKDVEKNKGWYKSISLYQQALEKAEKSFHEGNHERGVEYDTQAWQLRKELSKDTDRHFATHARYIGGHHEALNDYDNAITQYTEALGILDKNQEYPEDELFLNYSGLGNCLFELGKYYEAIDYYEKAYLALERLPDVDRYLKLGLLVMLGTSNMYLMQFEETDVHLTKVLELLKEAPDQYAELIAMIATVKGSNLFCMDKVKEGEDCLRETLESIKTMKDGAKYLCWIHMILGCQLSFVGRTEEGLFHIDQVIKISSKIESISPEIAMLIGMGFIGLELCENALPYLKKALDSHEEIKGNKGLNRGLLLGAIGKCLGAAGRDDEALTYLRAGLESCPQHPRFLYDRAIGSYHIASSLVMLERFKEAMSNYQYALDALTELFDSPRAEVARVHRGLAVCLATTGKIPEAIAAFENALAIYEQLPFSHDDEVAVCANDLGYLLLEHKDYLRSRTYLNLALEKSKVTANDTLIASSSYALGNLLQSIGRTEEAIEHLIVAFENFEKLQADTAIIMREIALDLISLLTKIKRIEDAIPYCRFALKNLNYLVGDQKTLKAFLSYNLGMAMNATGQYEEALPHLECSFDLYKNLHISEQLTLWSARSIGICLMRMRRYEEALPYLNAIYTAYFNSHEHPAMAALATEAFKRPVEDSVPAILYLGLAAKHLGECQMGMEDYNTALLYFEIAREADKYSIYDLGVDQLVGKCLLKLGRKNDAFKLAQKLKNQKNHGNIKEPCPKYLEI